MLKLGVNIDHVATVRQARGTPYPSLVEAARLCEAAGAHGITVHLREDRRHIQDRDVADLKHAINLPLNLEMACVPDVLDVARSVRPAEACLVPERRAEMTTECGLDAAGGGDDLVRTIRALQDAGVTVSLFIDPDPHQIDAAAEHGAEAVELHTGPVCEADPAGVPRELRRLVEAAGRARGLGLRVNAGHGINLRNIGAILRIPHLDTLNIGHSIVSRAIMVGLGEAVREMRDACSAYALADDPGE